jgi:VIT1/CCC1 family predicted Fe2+/Mn2+ transporter
MSSSSTQSDLDVLDVAKGLLRSELMVTEIYRKLADRFKTTELSQKLSEIAKEEEYHSSFWKTFLINRGEDPEEITFSRLKTNLLVFIYGLLGIGLTIKLLEAGERKVIRRYSETFSSDAFTPEERRGVLGFLLAEFRHEESFMEYEKRYRFFINQISTIFTQTSGGLVIVLSTAIGFSNVYSNSFMIGVAGLIVGLISAMNTVVGFYFFGRTGRRIKEDILNNIYATCSYVPDAYMERVKKYMCDRGYSEEVAESIANDAREKGLIESIIAEEEYGIKGELQNPVSSAVWAGVFKTIATVLPLMPFFFGLRVSYAIPVSIIVTLILITIAGSLTAIAAEVSVKEKVIELISGLFVLASLTYVLGKSTQLILTYFNQV